MGGAGKINHPCLLTNTFEIPESFKNLQLFFAGAKKYAENLQISLIRQFWKKAK
jgi:deoxyadenosine/deoxycytidine kinase